MVICVTDGGGMLKLISIPFVLELHILISFSFDHWVTVSTAFCSMVSSELFEIEYSVVSSMYLYVGMSVMRSLIIRRKRNAPSFVPCGPYVKCE